MKAWSVLDAPALFHYARDSRVGPSMGWKQHKTIEDSIHAIKTIYANEFSFAIVTKNAFRLCGGTSVVRSESASEVGISFWIAPPFWGMGYATEAVMGLIDHSFKEYNFERVWCNYFEGNCKSKRVQEKCGFTYCYSRERYCEALGQTMVKHYSCTTRDQWAETYTR